MNKAYNSETGEPSSARRHCIVTEEFSGLNMSGGIGAASHGLARMLAGMDYRVDILITDLSCNRDTHDSVLPLSNMRLFFLSDETSRDNAVSAPVDEITKSFCTYRFLKQREYNTIHFNEWLGTGFYSTMARTQGLFNSRIITHLHGSSEWVRRHNLYFVELEDFEREAIEKSQIENSDLVISPSKYLLSYYKESGVSVPDSVQLNWTLPQWHDGGLFGGNEPLTTREIASNSVSELIFFGRHERRKGFELFVDAIARLPSDIAPDLTFIGRFDRVGHEFSGSHVFRRISNYTGRIRFINHFNQEEALGYINSRRNALCVMPSIIENSPCVVGECFSIGAPFIATDVGGVSELVDPNSIPFCLVPPDARALAEAIRRVIESGMPQLRSTLVPKIIQQRWADKLRSLEEPSAASPPEVAGIKPVSEPLVTICVSHYERPEYLRRALDRIMDQTYSNVEVVIVDDGSRRVDAREYLDLLEKRKHRFPVTVIRSANKYLGAARNLAARYANGEFILFHDDDNLAERREVEIFVSAALCSGCEILTSQYWVFRENGHNKRKIEYYPIGIGGAFSFFRNRFGDANSLIRRETFERVGGFTELHGVGWEDWEFFLRAYIHGAKMGVVPEPLFNYRVSAGSMLKTTSYLRNSERIYSMIDEELPRLNSDILRYAQREVIRKQVLDQLWAVLQRSPAAELHQQLTALDPNSIEARRKLSDLAFEVGRVGDAIELGITDYEQRQKMLALVYHLKRSDAIALEEKVFVTLNGREGQPALALRGWAFVQNGSPLVPEELIIDNQYFVTVASEPTQRPDVAKHHKIAGNCLVGFRLVAVQSDTGRLKGRSAGGPRQIVPSPFERRIEVLGVRDWSFKAHVDEIIEMRKVAVAIPSQKAAGGSIVIQSTAPAYTYLRDGDQFVQGEMLMGSRVKFNYKAGKRERSLTFIVPDEEEGTTLEFE